MSHYLLTVVKSITHQQARGNVTLIMTEIKSIIQQQARGNVTLIIDRSQEYQSTAGYGQCHTNY